VFEGDGTPINTLEGRPFNMVGEIFPLNRINTALPDVMRYSSSN